MRGVLFATLGLGFGALVAGEGPPWSAGAVPSIPDPDGYWGFAAGLHPAEAERRGFAFPPDFPEIRATGSSYVLLPVSWQQADVESVELGRSKETLPDPVLRRVIQDARDASLGVVLLPLVTLSEGGKADWRGVIRPSSLDAWWRSYTDFILHYAELAAEERVDMLVVGSELSSRSGPASKTRWRQLVRRVRSRYPGPLAYSANHDALDLRAPFGFVDVVGISAYFSLEREGGPGAAQAYRDEWRRILQRLARVEEEIGKPLVLLEVGYPSVEGGARRPWDYTSAAPIDLEEQRAAYAALRNAAQNAHWLDGLFFWNWLGPGGVHDRWYTPRGKPAMIEAERLLRAKTGK